MKQFHGRTYGFLCERDKTMSYLFIDAKKADYLVLRMCKVLAVG